MSVQVRFTGICTHLDNVNGKHRVILVHAEHGAYIREKTIPPHIPKLHIKPEYVVKIDGDLEGLKPTENENEWQLCGVALTFENSQGQSVEKESKYTDIPKLSQYTAKAPGLSAEVTVKGQAACYFDLESGRMTSDTTPHGAVYGIWNDDGNGLPVLRVTPFWNRESTTLIHLRPGAEVDIMHTGKQLVDSPYDFLLHYCILNYVPDDAKVPEENKKRTMKKNPGDISMGCSNSGYP
jgi:hypothetical protein